MWTSSGSTGVYIKSALCEARVFKTHDISSVGSLAYTVWSFLTIRTFTKKFFYKAVVNHTGDFPIITLKPFELHKSVS